MIIIEEQNTQILHLLKNQKREVGEITPYMPNVPTPLPLNTVNHIAEIELFLSNEEAFSALVRKIPI